MIFNRFKKKKYERRLFKAAEEISSPTTAEAADETDTDLPALPPKHKKVKIFGNIILIRELLYCTVGSIKLGNMIRIEDC